MNTPIPPRRRAWPRALALLAAAVVLIALAAATFTLSYSGIHEIALGAGVPPRLARVYPGLLDAALVIACLAAIVLWDAKWWARWYAWLAIIVMVAVGGGADAVHAMNVALPHRRTVGVIAAVPWLLLLLAFSLWLTVLRQSRSRRGTAPQDPPKAAPPAREVMAPAQTPRPTGIPQPMGPAAPVIPAPMTIPAATVPAPTVPVPTVPVPTVPVPTVSVPTMAPEPVAAPATTAIPGPVALPKGTASPEAAEAPQAAKPREAAPLSEVADDVGLDDLLALEPERSGEQAVAAGQDDPAPGESEAATPADSASEAETVAAEDSTAEDAGPVAAEPEADEPADVPAEADAPAEADVPAEESATLGEGTNDEARGGAEGEAPEAVAAPERATPIPQPEATVEAGPAPATAAPQDEGTTPEPQDADAEGADSGDQDDAARGVTPPPDADEQASDDQIPVPVAYRTPDYWDIENEDDVPGGTYPVLSARTESPEETGTASEDAVSGEDEAPEDDEPGPEERGTPRPRGTQPTEVHHSLSELAAQAPPLPIPSTRRLNRLRSTPVPPEEDAGQRS